MRRSLILLLAVVPALLLAGPTHAGTYEVRACATAYGAYPNHAWAFTVPSNVWATATTCAGARPELTLLMRGDTATPAFQKATMTFTPPAGALIRDFTLNRQVYYYNPTRDAGTSPPYILYSWGGLQFAGAGEYDAATRDAINATGHWYGYPSGASDTGGQIVSKASFPRLNGQPDTNSLTIDVGCWGNPCSLAANANVFTTLYGARVTVTDGSRPSVSADGSSGLYSGGSHGGDESVRFSASDNVGVRRAELIDLTDPGNARVVGRKDNGCNFAYARPCSNFSDASITPSARLPSGTRTLALRVTDTAGNQATTPPQGSLVGGPLNGSNASGSGRLRAVFTKGGKTGRTVKPGGQPSVSISLRNGARQPIGDARIQVRARQLRTGAHFTSAGEVRTSADGRARLVLPRGSSRELRFEYRTRVDDPSPALGARVRLGVRPRATLRVRPKRVRNGGTIRLAGRVRSRPLPRPGKLIVLQAFDRGRWRAFATTRSGKGGRFSRRYRFTRTFQPRSFRLRARLPREAAYPYSTGNTRTVRVRVG